jgi:hypothetical protein
MSLTGCQLSGGLWFGGTAYPYVTPRALSVQLIMCIIVFRPYVNKRYSLTGSDFLALKTEVTLYSAVLVLLIYQNHIPEDHVHPSAGPVLSIFQ